MENLLLRITVNPEANHGKPSIRNTRYTIESTLKYIAGGDNIEDLLRDFSDLDRSDILVCIAYEMDGVK